MIQVPYPTGEFNFVVPPAELELPESANPENRNNHHLYFTYRKLGEFLISRTFRDLSFNQLDMPFDQHTILHQRYSPPKIPTFALMIDVIEAAHDLGEPLKLQEKRQGPYYLEKISEDRLGKIYQEYNRLGERQQAA